MRRTRRLKRRSSVVGDEFQSQLHRSDLPVAASQINAAVGRVSAKEIASASGAAATVIVSPLEEEAAGDCVFTGSTCVVGAASGHATVIVEKSEENAAAGEVMNFEDVEGFEVVESDDEKKRE